MVENKNKSGDPKVFQKKEKGPRGFVLHLRNEPRVKNEKTEYLAA
jgi:hypothetical protein